MPYRADMLLIDLTSDASDNERSSPDPLDVRTSAERLLDASSPRNVSHSSLSQDSKSHLRQPRVGSITSHNSLSMKSHSIQGPSQTSITSADEDAGSSQVSISHGWKRKRGGASSTLTPTRRYQALDPNRESKIPRLVVRMPPPLYPQSAFEKTHRPGERSEAKALNELLQLPGVRNNSEYGGLEFTSIELTSFSVYWTFRDRRGHGLELPEYVSLHDMFQHPTQTFYFDGTLRAGGRSVVVRRVPFDVVTIGGFEALDMHTVDDEVWVASSLAVKNNVSYRLTDCVPEYRRFLKPFIWTANLVKHVADFIYNHKRVSIHDFRQKFCSWLQQLHGNDTGFQAWLRAYNDTCFMRAIACQTDCIRSQVETLGGPYSKHPLWAELTSTSIPRHPLPKVPKGSITKTIVTPYVGACFKQMQWGRLLKPVQDVKTQSFSFDWAAASKFTTRSLRSPSSLAGKAQVGDVVSIEPDEASVTNWKGDKEKSWYFYVLEIKQQKRTRRLHGLWLYSPSQTTLSTASYPYKNELFLSTHHDNLDEDDLEEILPVSFFSFKPEVPSQLFVRQVYDDKDSSFRTLHEQDLECSCKKAQRVEYIRGEAVLVEGLGQLLEPVTLLEGTEGLRMIRARRFTRARHLRDSAPPNELLYSDEVISLPYKSIGKRCNIRVFLSGKQIPAPHSCSGSGNCFFVIEKLTTQTTERLTDIPKDLVEGFDPELPAANRLNGLDLFCGCGTFGHSVECSGAVKVKWAVDLNEQALHSYFANTKEPSQVHFFCGSVDDFLLKAFSQEKGAPLQGEVHFIIAGSPCQGFSLMNGFKTSPKSLKNISLVASTASYIDFYKPRYVLLENVLGMTRTHKTTGENAFSQCLATFVGMGYQAQCFNVDACTEGAPQLRSRLIIALTAPGLTRLDFGLSHQYPDKMMNRSLGKAPNGLPFGERDLKAPRAFEHMTIAQACEGLPINPDGKTPSIEFPDHRPPVYDPYLVRQSLACVPRGLPGIESPATALLRGLVPRYIIDAQPEYWANPKKSQKDSKAWARVEPNRLVPTIIATFSPGDSFAGQCVHWNEDRPLSIEEARRAQQFDRRMVLIGSPKQRWRQIGNSVPRGISMALGVALRIAVDSNDTIEPWRKVAGQARSRRHSSVSLGSSSSIQPISNNGIEATRLEKASTIEFRKRNSGVPSTSRQAISNRGKAERTQAQILDVLVQEGHRQDLEGQLEARDLSDDDVIYIRTATSEVTASTISHLGLEREHESLLGTALGSNARTQIENTDSVATPYYRGSQTSKGKDSSATSASTSPFVQIDHADLEDTDVFDTDLIKQQDFTSDHETLLIDEFEDTQWAVDDADLSLL